MSFLDNILKIQSSAHAFLEDDKNQDLVQLIPYVGTAVKVKKLVQKSKSGDKEAQGKLVAIKALADGGDPKAQAVVEQAKVEAANTPSYTETKVAKSYYEAGLTGVSVGHDPVALVGATVREHGASAPLPGQPGSGVHWDPVTKKWVSCAPRSGPRPHAVQPRGADWGNVVRPTGGAGIATHFGPSQTGGKNNYDTTQARVRAALQGFKGSTPQGPATTGPGGRIPGNYGEQYCGRTGQPLYPQTPTSMADDGMTVLDQYGNPVLPPDQYGLPSGQAPTDPFANPNQPTYPGDPYGFGVDPYGNPLGGMGMPGGYGYPYSPYGQPQMPYGNDPYGMNPYGGMPGGVYDPYGLLGLLAQPGAYDGTPVCAPRLQVYDPDTDRFYSNDVQMQYDADTNSFVPKTGYNPYAALEGIYGQPDPYGGYPQVSGWTYNRPYRSLGQSITDGSPGAGGILREVYNRGLNG